MLYVGNQIMQTSRKQCGLLYIDLFFRAFLECIPVVVQDQPDYKKKILHLLEVLGNRKVLDHAQVSDLKNVLDQELVEPRTVGVAPPPGPTQTSTMPTQAPVPPLKRSDSTLTSQEVELSLANVSVPAEHLKLLESSSNADQEAFMDDLLVGNMDTAISKLLKLAVSRMQAGEKGESLQQAYNALLELPEGKGAELEINSLKMVENENYELIQVTEQVELDKLKTTQMVRDRERRLNEDIERRTDLIEGFSLLLEHETSAQEALDESALKSLEQSLRPLEALSASLTQAARLIAQQGKAKLDKIHKEKKRREQQKSAVSAYGSSGWGSAAKPGVAVSASGWGNVVASPIPKAVVASLQTPSTSLHASATSVHSSPTPVHSSPTPVHSSPTPVRSSSAPLPDKKKPRRSRWASKEDSKSAVTSVNPSSGYRVPPSNYQSPPSNYQSPPSNYQATPSNYQNQSPSYTQQGQYSSYQQQQYPPPNLQYPPSKQQQYPPPNQQPYPPSNQHQYNQPYQQTRNNQHGYHQQRRQPNRGAPPPRQGYSNQQGYQQPPRNYRN